MEQTQFQIQHLGKEYYILCPRDSLSWMMKSGVSKLLNIKIQLEVWLEMAPWGT